MSDERESFEEKVQRLGGRVVSPEEAEKRGTTVFVFGQLIRAKAKERDDDES